MSALDSPADAQAGRAARVEALAPPGETAADARAENIIARAMQPSPLMVVISGPSGVGKDEVIKLMQQRQAPLHFVVTATTRAKRPDEVDGVDYHFISVSEFAEMIEDGSLLEHALVYGDYKGIPAQQVREALDSGKDVILRIDVQGAETVRRHVQGAVSVFLIAESMAELERRLRERKTDAPDQLKMRIATAREEMKRAGEFDYIVVNERQRLEETVDTIMAIISAEKHRVSRLPISL